MPQQPPSPPSPPIPTDKRALAQALLKRKKQRGRGTEHPDRGGNAARFAQITRAAREALEALETAGARA